MGLIFDDSNRQIFAITCAYKGKKYGMVMTWLIRASLAAKRDRGVLVLSKYNDTAKALLKKKRFTVSLLNETQSDECYVLGSRHSNDYDKFQDIRHTSVANYGPIISGCISYAHCRVLKKFETPDRYIVYVEVDKEVVLNPQKKSLIQKIAFKKLNREQRKILDKKYVTDSKRDADLIWRG